MRFFKSKFFILENKAEKERDNETMKQSLPMAEWTNHLFYMKTNRHLEL